MKVRIVHFSGDYYTVKYSRQWYLPEKTYGAADISWSHPSLMERNKLKLFTIDEAKKLAESLTEESVLKHEQEQERIYEDAVYNAKKLNRERKAAAESANQALES